jgi:hypothetical protein
MHSSIVMGLSWNLVEGGASSHTDGHHDPGASPVDASNFKIKIDCDSVRVAGDGRKLGQYSDLEKEAE